MDKQLNLKIAEKRVFKTTFADGLWDVFLGCITLIFALSPLLSVSLGDFWSSVIFLPFLGIIYLLILVIRKKVIVPRLGLVVFGKERFEKLRIVNLVMVCINILIITVGIAIVVRYDQYSGNFFGKYFSLTGLLLLMGFCISAYFLNYARLYIYGLLFCAAFPVSDWLYTNHGAVHHGFPVVFGIIAGFIIFIGLVVFIYFVSTNPVVNGDGNQ